MERCLRRRNIYIPKGVPNASEVFLFSKEKVRRGFFTERIAKTMLRDKTPPSSKNYRFSIGLASSALL